MREKFARYVKRPYLCPQNNKQYRWIASKAMKIVSHNPQRKAAKDIGGRMYDVGKPCAARTQ